jgi:transposase
MNKRLKVVLNAWQRHRLRKIRDRSSSPRVGKRTVCLLLSADGASSRAIQQATGLSVDAITDIRRRWQQRTWASLEDRPRCGRPCRVTVAYRRELRQTLNRGPPAYGYLFTVWSIPRLNAHLKARTGIGFCDESVRCLVRAEGYVFRRPKHTLKGKRDEKAFRKAQRQLRRLKKGLCASTPTTNSGSKTKPSSTSTPT